MPRDRYTVDDIVAVRLSRPRYGRLVGVLSMSLRAAVGSRLVGAVGSRLVGVVGSRQSAAGRAEQSDGEPAGAAGQSD